MATTYKKKKNNKFIILLHKIIITVNFVSKYLSLKKMNEDLGDFFLCIDKVYLIIRNLSKIMEINCVLNRYDK